MFRIKAFAGALGCAAMVAGGISPSLAAPILPAKAQPAHAVGDLAWSPDADTAHDGYRRYRRHHRGIDGGDVLAGVLILGGIAAIASAASNSNRNKRYRDDRYDRPEPRDDYRPRYEGSELNAAADQCSYAAEQSAGGNARVDRITTVSRDGAGWRVEGLVSHDQGSDDFLCGVTNGQIDYIQIGR
ncbi:MAG: hypothetical protein R3E02_01470 [Blastomonas sp.]